MMMVLGFGKKLMGLHYSLNHKVKLQLGLLHGDKLKISAEAIDFEWCGFKSEIGRNPART